MDRPGDDEVTGQFVKREKMVPMAVAIFGVERRRGHRAAIAGGIAHEFLQHAIFESGKCQRHRGGFTPSVRRKVRWRARLGGKNIPGGRGRRG